ncbi:putative ALA-interacting subunit 2 isoform X4 [Phalaenopsis equestris]|uniref:putative ALA-interacting subunit 2 isoform X4 n=1 Tax=Phalaenopsis equestris TaxID=78828 RepID=UPI0009E51B3D|nr:putative ALA-interacting subunit 2 isoform X4 [Phalaenopsis equestris]
MEQARQDPAAQLNPAYSSPSGQENLPACRPALTPTLVITVFLLVGITFLPFGIICFRAAESVDELVLRYDTECIPENYRGNKVAYIKDDSISKKCTLTVKPRNQMKAPIYVYYELDNYYQNHRRYVKSRSDRQLLHGLQYKDTSSCRPIESSNGLPVLPCGLIAWSLFNDTFTFDVKAGKLNVNRKNISWKSDRDHKFGNDVYPFNFQNDTLIGGGKLDPSIPQLSEQEDLIVWMRVAALPNFRKLYGVIENDIDADEVITIQLSNNYNTYSFGGKKKLVLTTSNWLGGKNNFLGLSYIATGFCSILVAILFALIHVKFPRPHRDASYLHWNRKSSATSR